MTLKVKVVTSKVSVNDQTPNGLWENINKRHISRAFKCQKEIKGVIKPSSGLIYTSREVNWD